MRNHYAMLGVLPTSSSEEIKASYRQLVKRFHPDMPGGSATFFARIQEAYETLSEPRLRKTYDHAVRNPFERQQANANRRPRNRGATRPRSAWKAGTRNAGFTHKTNSRQSQAGQRTQQGQTQQPPRNGHQARNAGNPRPNNGEQSSKANPRSENTARSQQSSQNSDHRNGTRSGFAAGIRAAIRSKSKKNSLPLAMMTRVMSIAVARSGRFQLQGLIGNIEVSPTTPETLWPSTLKKFGSDRPEHLARHVIQIKLSGERDLVRSMMPRPTDFGVEFQQDTPEVQQTKVRTFLNNLMSNSPLSGLFTKTPFGLYGTFLPLTLQITVPKGLALYLRDITGTIVLGDLESDITAKVLGGVLKAGKVRNINLTLNGGSRAFIRNIQGNADLMGFGTSRIYLGGKIQRMRAVLDNEARAEIKAPIQSLMGEINGKGMLDARGPVNKAYLTVQDKGHARLVSLNSLIEFQREGQGRIEILHRRRNLSAGG